jgi:REP element-mobilizing transposase RayT
MAEIIFMPRPPRVHEPGVFFHVVHRGVERRAIFFGPADYDHYAALLSQGILRYGHRIHAFCLMPNHAHLFIQAGEIPIARAIQNVAFRYAQWVNRHRGRVGHLFQGRYKAHVVDHDRYANAVLRYVHRNPLRAGLVADLGGWPWSSHGEYLGRKMYPWVETSFLLSLFGGNPKERRRAYLEFVSNGAADESPAHWSVPAGRSATAREAGSAIVKRRLDPESVSAAIESVFGVSAQQLAAATRQEPVATARAVIAYLCIEHGETGPAELSRAFGRDPTAWVHASRRLRARLQHDRVLADAVRRVAAAAVPQAD